MAPSRVWPNMLNTANIHDPHTMSDSTSTDKKPNAALDTAQRIQEAFGKSELYIVDSQKQFDARTTTTDESIRLPLAFGESGGLVDPASVSLDLTAQLVSQE